MEQQKNFLATEPVEKLFRRLAFSAACCPYDNARSMRAMMFIHFFPTNGCKPHK